MPISNMADPLSFAKYARNLQGIRGRLSRALAELPLGLGRRVLGQAALEAAAREHSDQPPALGDGQPLDIRLLRTELWRLSQFPQFATGEADRLGDRQSRRLRPRSAISLEWVGQPERGLPCRQEWLE
jgi:hypothetical protein